MVCCPAQDLEKPEQMYRKLGAKLVVGMPFKDQACSDTLVLSEIPPAYDTDKRRALARLQVIILENVHRLSHDLLDMQGTVCMSTPGNDRVVMQCCSTVDALVSAEAQSCSA